MTTTDPSSTDSSELQHFVGPIWRRKWLLLSIVVIGTVGTYVQSVRQPKIYQSSTQFLVSSSPIEAIVRGDSTSISDQSSLDQTKLLVSRPVSERVIKRLGLAETPDALGSTVTAVPVSGSSYVSVTVVRNSGTQAAAIANAYVREYLGYRQDELAKEATVAIDRLRSQLRSLPRAKAFAGQRLRLQDTIRQLQARQGASITLNRQLNPAGVGGPIAPRPRQDAVFALAISLGLALALAFALERFDRRIRSIDEISELYGAPLLSIIPHATSPLAFRDGKAAVPDSLREPFRTLRTNVQLASLDQPVKRLVVASAVSGEGKSMIVRNLALTYREWGLTVAVLEADLRRPTLSESFGVENDGRGLTSVLSGGCDLEEALVDIDFDVASLEYLDKVLGDHDAKHLARAETTVSSARNLALLRSGDTPPNPQAVLATERTRQVIEQLSERYDIVLIDTPPLAAVSDAIALLPQADGVVMVTRVGMTERLAGRRAAAAVGLDPSVRILGVIANDLAFQPGYGYGYGTDYGSRNSSNGKKAES